MSDNSDIPRKTPRSISRNLVALRRKIFQWFFVDGSNRVLCAIIGLCALSFGIDRLTRMDKPQRGVMLVLGISALCYVVWRFLIKPLFSKLSDDALVLQVENQTDEVKEELISALEFSRIDWDKHPNVSRGMVAHTIAQGEESGSKVDFSKVLRGGRFATNCILLLVLGAVVCGGAVMAATNDSMKIWFNRNILLGNMQWPQDYFFDVDGVVDGTISVPRGDDWPIIAKVRDGYTSLPEGAKIEFKSKGGANRSATMDPGSDGTVFLHTLREVTEEYQFRITTKKIDGEWIKVRLLERPEITEIALEQTPPEYTGDEKSSLEIGSGPYYLLRGSQLSVSGKTSKVLSKATLSVGDNAMPLKVDGQNFSGTISAEKLAAGTYFLEIFDTEQVVIPDPEVTLEATGLTASTPAQFKVRLRDDTEPDVSLALRGVSTMIVPRARLPYKATVEDDYSIVDIKIGYEVKADRAAVGDTTEGEVTPAGIAAKLGERLIEIEDYIELEPLEIPVDSRLSITMRGTDNDAINPEGPKVGKSTTIHLRVVNESELRTDLLRREKEQRQVLDGLMKTQDEILTDTQAFLAECRTLEKLPGEMLSRLVNLQRQQKGQSTSLKPMVERIDGIIDEISNNRLEEEDGVLKRRLRTKVLTPLSQLWEEMVPITTSQLEAARRAPDDVENRNAILEDAIVRQEQIIEVMRQILTNMVKDEDFQQAVNLLYEMQKLQGDLNKKTDAEKAARLKELIEGTNNPSEDEDKEDEEKSNKPPAEGVE